MNGPAVLKNTLKITNMVLHSYVGDLTDAELLTRPGAGCNHIAFQLGHLISSNCDLLNSVAPGAAPALPEGFAAKHSKENAASNDPADFRTKQEYLDLFAQVDAAVNAALDKTTDSQLDEPAPEKWRAWFPTAGDIWSLIVTHSLMHAGQWVPVRRALGKPVVI